MALTATYQEKGGDFETAEDGRYVCRLSKVFREPRPSFDDPNVMEDNFVWDFETVRDRDSQDRPYRFRTYTKTKYGNEKAKLTLLIDGMFGRTFLSQQIEQMDFEKLVGQTFAVMVSVTPAGKNKVLSVKCGKGQEPNYEDFLIGGADQSITPPKAATKRPSALDSDEDPFDK